MSHYTKIYDEHTHVGRLRRYVRVEVVSNDHHILAQLALTEDCQRHLALALAEVVRTGIVQRDVLERMLGLAFDYVADKPPPDAAGG